MTPARESERGRGAPFFDLHAVLDGVEVGISAKVSTFAGDPRLPRNGAVCGGKPEHLLGLILAAQEGVLLPVIQWWQDAAGQWYRLAFDAGRILRGFDPAFTAGWGELLSGEFPNLAAQACVARFGAVTGLAPVFVESGDGGAFAISPMVRGGGRYVYLNAKIGHAAAGLAWVRVEAPTLPSSLGELLEWCGEETIG